MLDTLITSKTRIKLLTRLFLNPNLKGHLRGLADEFGESTNAIRIELNRFEDAGLLIGEKEGNKKMFHANIKHPLYNAIYNLLLSHHGIDVIIEKVIKRLGNVDQVYALGAIAEGKEEQNIQLQIVGDSINLEYLNELIAKAKKFINRKIDFIVSTQASQVKPPCLLLWEK